MVAMLRSRAGFETALLVAGFALLAFVLPHGISGDDSVRFADVEQLIHHGHLTDSRYSLLGPLLSAPVLLLGEVIGTPQGWADHFNVILVAVAILAGYRLTRDRMEPALYRAFALVLLFASFLTERLRDYDTEITTTVLVVFGLLAVLDNRRPLLGWVAIVVGVANTPAAMGGLVLVAAARALETRRVRPVLAVIAAALLVAGEAWLRRGSPVDTGYASDHGVQTLLPYSGRGGFSYPFVLGVLSILLSFGRGLAFFAPGLLFWLGPRTRRVAPGHRNTTLQLLFLTGLVLAYAKWWAWYGGGSWGPRFFVFAAVPASLLLATRLRTTTDTALGCLITLSVLALSSWVSLCGLLESATRANFCLQQNYQVEYVCWYTPEYSGLWWPVLRRPPWTATSVTLAAFCLLVFVYFAAPLLRRLLRTVGPARAQLAHGWRF